jgi:hypothetical protein
MNPDTRFLCPAIPTANPQDTTLFDEGEAANPKAQTASEDRRLMVSVFMDQAATIFHDVYLPKADGTLSTTPRAGNGSGDAVTGSTVLHKDYKLLPGRNVLRIHTTTVPTVWEVGVRLVPDRAVGT